MEVQRQDLKHLRISMPESNTYKLCGIDPLVILVHSNNLHLPTSWWIPYDAEDLHLLQNWGILSDVKKAQTCSQNTQNYWTSIDDTHCSLCSH